MPASPRDGLEPQIAHGIREDLRAGEIVPPVAVILSRVAVQELVAEDGAGSVENRLPPRIGFRASRR